MNRKSKRTQQKLGVVQSLGHGSLSRSHGEAFFSVPEPAEGGTAVESEQLKSPRELESNSQPSCPTEPEETPAESVKSFFPEAPNHKRPKLVAQASLLAAQPSRNPKKAINIAVSSRALFNLDSYYNKEDDKRKLREFLEQVQQHENDPYPPGVAFRFISALGNVNKCLQLINPDEPERFNIILMSHNHAHVGVKLIKSINHHNLHIERMCLTGGTSPVPDYLKAYNVSLFLTSYPCEVEMALAHGYAAAMMSDQQVKDSSMKQLRIAFDLDAVLFSDDSEVQYKTGGLSAFFEHEKEHINEIIEQGPLKDFAQAVGRMQEKFNNHSEIVPESPIRIYIVTARSAASAGERAIKTLRAWGLHIDEIHFLAGAPKGPILSAIKPHIFFDDQQSHITDAQEHGISAAQVRSGIANRTSACDVTPKSDQYRFGRNLSLVHDQKRPSDSPQDPQVLDEPQT